MSEEFPLKRITYVQVDAGNPISGMVVIQFSIRPFKIVEDVIIDASIDKEKSYTKILSEEQLESVLHFSETLLQLVDEEN